MGRGLGDAGCNTRWGKGMEDCGYRIAKGDGEVRGQNAESKSDKWGDGARMAKGR